MVSTVAFLVPSQIDHITLHYRHFKRHLHLKWPVVHQQLHVIRNTAHRPSTQANYTASRVRPKQENQLCSRADCSNTHNIISSMAPHEFNVIPNVHSVYDARSLWGSLDTKILSLNKFPMATCVACVFFVWFCVFLMCFLWVSCVILVWFLYSSYVFLMCFLCAICDSYEFLNCVFLVCHMWFLWVS